MFNYFRYALRQLRKSLGFTLTAVLTLAIGIGGVAAAFSIVYAVLMRPLPYAEPSQLVRIHEGIRHFFEQGELSPPDVLTFQHDSLAFSSVAGFTNASYELTGDNIQQPIRAKAERVSATFFPLLGAHPLLGRNFTRSEDSNSAAVVVLSYPLWQNQLHSDPGVLRSE
ncbi:ABC transporter permease [Acidipila rosea]|uniref:MacB-like protein n=1 Tax=Acidipila rosea TaxID=768535 RepID=A0A4R1LBI6_9BACT|nr:ABC transporter permease [Acidipila rosea]TCK75836.1 MacB-like protein [Acidipila rosea]